MNWQKFNRCAALALSSAAVGATLLGVPAAVAQTRGKGGGGGDDGGGTPPPADPAIAFVGGSNCVLSVMNEDGTNVTALGVAPAAYPAWSPDLDGDASNGYQGALAFEMRLGDGLNHVVLADVRVLDGTPAALRVRTLTAAAGYEPAWSPDLDAATPGYQGKIVFGDDACNALTQAVAWDGNASDPSTVHDPTPVILIDVAPLGVGIVFTPTWSPDGSRLAFVGIATIDGGSDFASQVIDDLANPQPRVIDAGTSPGAVDWSSTSSVIAYNKSQAIVLNDVDRIGEVATGAAGRDPSFSPDDTAIVFKGMVGRNWAIQRYDFSTGVTTTLLSQKRVNFLDPDWRPFD